VAKSGGSSVSAGNRIPAHRALGVQHPGASVWCGVAGGAGGKEGSWKAWSGGCLTSPGRRSLTSPSKPH
jgi:hypothetical protein